MTITTTNERGEVRQEKFSHSSAQKYIQCPRKYYHYKVIRTPRDFDAAQDTYALRFGKAFHKLMEDYRYGELDTRGTLDAIKSEDFVTEYQLTSNEDQIKLLVLARKMYMLHRSSGLKCAFVEHEIGNADTIGYVDLGLVNSFGYWWIVDLKTKARLSHTLFQQLPEDPQLNFYGYFASDIANKHGLDPSKFLGYKYRIARKTPAKWDTRKSVEENTEHFYKLSEAYEITVPLIQGKPQEVYEQMTNMFSDIKERKEIGEEAFPCNYGSCETYSSPCEYWSQCHQVPFSEAARRVVVYTHDNMEDQNIDYGNNETLEDLF